MHRDNELRAIARRYGFEFWRKTKRSHEIWRHPNGSTVLIAGSPGDVRGQLNFEAEVKRKSKT